jgi:hypothetical protein
MHAYSAAGNVLVLTCPVLLYEYCMQEVPLCWHVLHCMHTAACILAAGYCVIVLTCHALHACILAAGDGTSSAGCAELLATSQYNGSTAAAKDVSAQQHSGTSAQHGPTPQHTSTQQQDSSAASQINRSALYAAHAADISETAAQLVPRKTSADKGGFIEFLLLVSEEGNLPSFQVREASLVSPCRSSSVP